MAEDALLGFCPVSVNACLMHCNCTQDALLISPHLGRRLSSFNITNGGQFLVNNSSPKYSHANDVQKGQEYTQCTHAAMDWETSHLSIVAWYRMFSICFLRVSLSIVPPLTQRRCSQWWQRAPDAKGQGVEQQVRRETRLELVTG